MRSNQCLETYNQSGVERGETRFFVAASPRRERKDRKRWSAGAVSWWLIRVLNGSDAVGAFELFGSIPSAFCSRRSIESAFADRLQPIRRRDHLLVFSIRGSMLVMSKPKFASAHDLRRAFGTRWARQVMPAVLKELMRHANIETTVRFYVDIGGQETAAMLFALQKGDTSGDTSKSAVSRTMK